MWSILGSQSEERTPILGSGAGFAAQKQFLANVEAANVQAGGRGSERSTEKDICCPVQNRGKLDFMLGKQLYMCPSDMYLVANHIEGYNNKIQIATTAMLPGTNQSLNTEKLPPTGRPFILAFPFRNHGLRNGNGHPHSRPVHKCDTKGPTTDFQQHHATHEDNKTFLTVAAIGVGIVYSLVAQPPLPVVAAAQPNCSHGNQCNG